MSEKLDPSSFQCRRPGYRAPYPADALLRNRLMIPPIQLPARETPSLEPTPPPPRTEDAKHRNGRKIRLGPERGSPVGGYFGGVEKRARCRVPHPAAAVASSPWLNTSDGPPKSRSSLAGDCSLFSGKNAQQLEQAQKQVVNRDIQRNRCHDVVGFPSMDDVAGLIEDEP